MPARVDFSGKRIGRVVVLERDTSKPKSTFWKAICDCGTHFSCYSRSFKRGDRFECKKCMLERKRGIDLTGRIYGRWTVTGMGINEKGKTVCHCTCDCGSNGDIEPYVLNHPKKSKSCGCLGRKMKSKYVNSTLYPPSHRLSTSSFYAIRTELIHKCYKEKHQSYPKFGGQGITVCELWRNGAKDMYEWALFQGWEEKTIFCLKEGQREFGPETVYLVPNHEYRSSVAQKQGLQITYKGETHSVARWAEIMNIDRSQLIKKIKQLPSIDEAFTYNFRKCKFLRDPSLVQKAINLYENGMTIADVGRCFEMTPPAIKYHLDKHGVKTRTEPLLKKPMITNEAIQKLLNEGLSKKEISRRLLISDTSIGHRINKMNGIKRLRHHD